jgi:hypothetical protein
MPIVQKAHGRDQTDPFARHPLFAERLPQCGHQTDDLHDIPSQMSVTLIAAPSHYDILAWYATYAKHHFYRFFLFDLFMMSLYTTAVLIRKHATLSM